MPTCHQRNTITLFTVWRSSCFIQVNGKRDSMHVWKSAVEFPSYIIIIWHIMLLQKYALCSFSTFAGVIKAEVDIRCLCLLVWIPAHWHLQNKLSSVGIVCVLLNVPFYPRTGKVKRSCLTSDNTNGDKAVLFCSHFFYISEAGWKLLNFTKFFPCTVR